jgi:hypothetical protein
VNDFRLKHLRTAVLILTLSAISHAQATDEIAKSQQALKQGQQDGGDLVELERHRSDPRTIPALKEAFARGGPKRKMQEIAGTLLRVGEKADVYFDFLAAFVKEALADRTPYWISYDTSGHLVNGGFSPEFENWCRAHDEDLKTAAELQYSRGFDVWMLAQGKDARAVPLFLEGLDSPNHLVISYSALGLAQLQITSALPRIEKRMESLAIDANLVIAAQLPWFSSVEAYRMMERFVPNANLREFMRRQVAVGQGMARPTPVVKEQDDPLRKKN